MLREILYIVSHFLPLALAFVLGVIVFLWGSAVARDTVCEKYLISYADEEILKVRRENTRLKEQISNLLAKNKEYMNTFSGVRHVMLKHKE